jgi:hypothetical protein
LFRQWSASLHTWLAICEGTLYDSLSGSTAATGACAACCSRPEVVGVSSVP